MVETRVVLVKACLNGARSREEHTAVPLSPPELAWEGRRAVDAGAGALHAHPRLPDGSPTLDPAMCDAVVAAIRQACPGVPVGLTTTAQIEPDSERRLSLIARWRSRPDFASVNFDEDAAVELCELLISHGTGVEAGLSSVADAEALIASGFLNRCLRILIEPAEAEADAAVATAAAIDRVLEQGGVEPRRLHHGYDMATWAVLDAALARARDIRIGLEDTLQLPDGTRAADNAELVAHAMRMVARHNLQTVPPA